MSDPPAHTPTHSSPIVSAPSPSIVTHAFTLLHSHFEDTAGVCAPLLWHKNLKSHRRRERETQSPRPRPPPAADSGDGWVRRQLLRAAVDEGGGKQLRAPLRAAVMVSMPVALRQRTCAAQDSAFQEQLNTHTHCHTRPRVCCVCVSNSRIYVCKSNIQTNTDSSPNLAKLNRVQDCGQTQ